LFVVPDPNFSNFFVVVVTMALALVGQRAQADATAEEEPPAHVASYHGEVLVVDGVAVGLLGAGMGMEWTTGGGGGGAFFGVVSGSLYLVGAPLTHMTRQRYGRAALSAAIRVGLPLLGVVVADLLPREPGTIGAHYFVMGVGALVACALDALVLAKGDPPPPERQRSWTPVATPASSGFTLGVTGRF
jgi:hypothetical protein